MFRHGSEAVRICDEALSVSGPSDPRIAKIIQTDQNAQMAYHVHKALGFALEVRCTVCTVILNTTNWSMMIMFSHILTYQEYKKITGRGSGGSYSGFGDVFRAGAESGAVHGVIPGPGPGQVSDRNNHHSSLTIYLLFTIIEASLNLNNENCLSLLPCHFNVVCDIYFLGPYCI